MTLTVEAPTVEPPTVEPTIQHNDAMTETPEDLPTLTFIGPLAGFPALRHFALVALDELGALYSLRSLDDPALRFLVMPPTTFFPAYSPEIDDEWVERLDLSSADDALVLLVVTPGSGAADATANLLAPVVVNTRTREAAQVVLQADLPLRAPLVATR